MARGFMREKANAYWLLMRETGKEEHLKQPGINRSVLQKVSDRNSMG